jgi:hypothetical protein
VYRHPDYSKLTLRRDNATLHNVFLFLKETGLKFIVLGDFNLRDNYILPLLSSLHSLDLRQIVDEPTRQNNLLDLIIFPNSLSIVSHVIEPGLSDHKLTYCILELKVSKPEKVNFLFRPYGSLLMGPFYESLCSSLMLGFSNATDGLSQLHHSILSTFDKHCPTRMKSFVPKMYKKHLSSQTKSLIKERDLAFKLSQTQSSRQHSERHSELKKTCEKRCPC